MAEKHKWQFPARFRRGGFGWRSQPAVKRVKEATSEIKKVARRDPVLAAEGAVRFLEKVSPALEHVDGSSGAIGTAVHKAIEAMVPIIADAPLGGLPGGRHSLRRDHEGRLGHWPTAGGPGPYSGPGEDRDLRRALRDQGPGQGAGVEIRGVRRGPQGSGRL